MPRSHAARTCVACKKGKRRCELPTSSQRLSGGVPLAIQDSCSRCQRIGVTCVLDATYRYSHLHSLTPVTASSTTGDDDEIPPPSNLHTHPLNVQDYQSYFPRYLPFSLLRDFHARSITSQPQLPPSEWHDTTLDAIISEEQAAVAASWCTAQIPQWVPFTPSPLLLRRLRRSSRNEGTAVKFLEATQYHLAAQQRALPLPPTTFQRLTNITRGYLAELVASPSGEHLSQALVCGASFLSLGEPVGVYAQISNLGTEKSKGNGLQGRIGHVSAVTMVAMTVFGDDDHYCERTAALRLPSMTELDALEAELRTATLSSPNWNGAHAVLLRCRGWILAQTCVATCWGARNEPEAARLGVVDEARATFSNDMKALNARRERVLGSTSHLSAWLELEVCVLDLVLSGVALQHALGQNFTPQLLHDVIKRTAGSEQMQAFVHIHGPANFEATECVLASIATLPTKDKLVLYPTTVTSAYALRAMINALEIHASAFKLWHLPPPRGPVLASLMKSADEVIHQLKGGGGEVALRVAMAGIAAARATIQRWRTELLNMPYDPQPTPWPALSPQSAEGSLLLAPEERERLASSFNCVQLSTTVESQSYHVDGILQPESDPIVSSFAAWIQGIDWGQLVLPE